MGDSNLIYKEYNPKDGLTWYLSWKEVNGFVYYKIYRKKEI